MFMENGESDVLLGGVARNANEQKCASPADEDSRVKNSGGKESGNLEGRTVELSNARRRGRWDVRSGRNEESERRPGAGRSQREGRSESRSGGKGRDESCSPEEGEIEQSHRKRDVRWEEAGVQTQTEEEAASVVFPGINGPIPTGASEQKWSMAPERRSHSRSHSDSDLGHAFRSGTSISGTPRADWRAAQSPVWDWARSVRRDGILKAPEPFVAPSPGYGQYSRVSDSALMQDLSEHHDRGPNRSSWAHDMDLTD